MSLLRAFYHLKAPLVSLAFCALLAQQVVGFVLTASPVMAYESGFSLCLSGPLSSSDDPMDMVSGAGFCPCTVQHAAAVLPTTSSVQPFTPNSVDSLLPVALTRATLGLTTGPPPARAPPVYLHTA